MKINFPFINPPGFPGELTEAVFYQALSSLPQEMKDAFESVEVGKEGLSPVVLSVASFEVEPDGRESLTEAFYKALEQAFADDGHVAGQTPWRF